MDKDRDILKDFFKEKLQDYAPSVKRNLWSSLESYIHAEKSLWRRIFPAVVSAAAVLIIIILSNKFIFNGSLDSVEPISSVIENKDVIQDNELIDREKTISEDIQSVEKDAGKAERKDPPVDMETNNFQTYISEERDTKVVMQTKNSGQELNNVQEELTANNDSIAQNLGEKAILPESEIIQEPLVGDNEEKKSNKPDNEDMKNIIGNNSNYYTQIRSKGNAGFKMQISFSGKGFPAMSNDLDYFKIYNTEYLSSYENKFQIDELFLVQSESTTGQGSEDSYPSWFPADNYSLKNIKYHTPVTLSLYVSRDISPRWAIETGLSYTKLSSEEIWEAEINYYYYTDILTNNTKLDYLGIPLRASYYLIKKDRLFVYLSGGGMIEKCISGKAFTVAEKAKKEENTNLKISELQYSITGGVGIGLQLFKPLSLFVEPGVIYYFDDGSDIMTIRKDKPFNYNIQGGLRFSF